MSTHHCFVIVSIPDRRSLATSFVYRRKFRSWTVKGRRRRQPKSSWLIWSAKCRRQKPWLPKRKNGYLRSVKDKPLPSIFYSIYFKKCFYLTLFFLRLCTFLVLILVIFSSPKPVFLFSDTWILLTGAPLNQVQAVVLASHKQVTLSRKEMVKLESSCKVSGKSLHGPTYKPPQENSQEIKHKIAMIQKNYKEFQNKKNSKQKSMQGDVVADPQNLPKAAEGDKKSPVETPGSKGSQGAGKATLKSFSISLCLVLFRFGFQVSMAATFSTCIAMGKVFISFSFTKANEFRTRHKMW